MESSDGDEHASGEPLEHIVSVHKTCSLFTCNSPNSNTTTLKNDDLDSLSLIGVDLQETRSCCSTADSLLAYEDGDKPENDVCLCERVIIESDCDTLQQSNGGEKEDDFRTAISMTVVEAIDELCEAKTQEACEAKTQEDDQNPVEMSDSPTDDNKDAVLDINPAKFELSDNRSKTVIILDDINKEEMVPAKATSKKTGRGSRDGEDGGKMKSLVAQYACLGKKSTEDVDDRREMGKLLIRSASYEVAVKTNERTVCVRSLVKRYSQTSTCIAMATAGDSKG